MKAFVLGVLAAIALAVVSGVVAQSSFTRSADQTLATSSSRVGANASIDGRGWR